MRFWDLIDAQLHTRGVVTTISYEDRYLATPVSCALLVELLSSLKVRFESKDAWRQPKVTVTTSPVGADRPDRYRHQWTTDWPRTDMRDCALVAAFEYSGITATVESKPRAETPHSRQLRIGFSDGTAVAVWLDQGLSYWTQARKEFRTQAAVFKFTDDENELKMQLGDIKIRVEGHSLSTRVYLEV